MPSITVFANGTIIDGTGAAPRRGDVLVEDDRITALGEEATLHAARIAGSITRIDASGMTVMPGLATPCPPVLRRCRSNAEILPPLTRVTLFFFTAISTKVLRAGVTTFSIQTRCRVHIDAARAIEAASCKAPYACGA